MPRVTAAALHKVAGSVVETLLHTPNKATVAVARLSHRTSFPLQRGGVLPPGSLHVKFASFGDESLPVVLLCPSMSNTPFAVDIPELGQVGWWNKVVGHGPGFGIRLDKYRVIVPSPLGSPHGSTSPLSFKPGTCERFGPDFPVVTPADMADVNAWLLDELGIDRVHAVIGGSMGGMQALQFAVRYPDRADRLVAIASTGRTSPSTVGLRSVQRAVIQLDPAFKDGHYDPDSVRKDGPVGGMSVARMFGTIGYRSRSEFDARFAWQPAKPGRPVDHMATRERDGDGAEPGHWEHDDEDGHKFEIERYLEHAAKKFVGGGDAQPYDPNCYLRLSQAMDLMDLGAGHPPDDSFEAAVAKYDGDVMLLPYSTDTLMPPSESLALAKAFESVRSKQEAGADAGGDAEQRPEYLRGLLPPRIDARVHCEVLETHLGHDAFLAEPTVLNARLAAFLSTGATGARRVHELERDSLLGGGL